jgi:aspartyl protease family protein
MVDSSIKTVALLAMGATMAASWATSDPERARSILAVIQGATGAASASPTPPRGAPQQLFAAAPASLAQRSAPVGAAAGYGREDLKADAGGQFQSDIELDGTRVHMLVDTGATFVSLTYADAEKLGFRPPPAEFTVPVQTANGASKAARLTLKEVRLGTLMVSNVPALVMPEDVKGTSLLGMSFLKKLGGFEASGGTLSMRQ